MNNQISNALESGESKQVDKLYLDYVNNFITVQCFAEYYGAEFNDAMILIRLARWSRGLGGG